jgi:hypothetical protein
MSGVMLVAAARVGPITAAVAVLVFVVALAIGVWAIRRQTRQFPEGFDRTGWSPERSRASWFLAKFTWLSGSRG